jgi:tetratricopeptide (TPR) repeat protein
VAREICERQGLKAMLVGSIAPLGSHYVIDLQAVNAHTGDVLAREQVEAESKEQVLSVLGKAGTSLREKLGESLSTIQKFDAPPENTTSSLEALKYKSAAVELMTSKPLEAISLLKRAVELDPQFALGYSALAVNSNNIGQREAAREYAAKAYELRERASEPEKLWIIAHYYLWVTGELEKAIETQELLKQTYPRHRSVRNLLANTYSFVGQHEKAAEEMQEAVRLEPNNPLFYRNLARQLRCLGRFQEAKAVLERASAQKLDTPWLHLERYVNAFLQGDASEMQGQMEWFRARPDEPSSFGLQTAVAEVAGQYRKAREFREQWVEVFKRGKNKEAAAGNAAGDAQTDALSGRCELVRQDADRSLAFARTPSSLRTAAVALALCGELGRAQSLADEYARLMPTDTLANGVDLPVIRAAIANHRGNYAQAIELLKTARRYDHAEPFKLPLDLDQFAPYLRGQAFLGQHAGVEAAAEFQYLLDHRGLAPFSLLGPLSQLGLARAAVLTGDATKARKAYQDFFALWKDADADLPVLIAAKKEYKKLK